MTEDSCRKCGEPYMREDIAHDLCLDCEGQLMDRIMPPNWREDSAEFVQRNGRTNGKEEGVSETKDILWCCHVRGPDDVIAAPNYETALAWADKINAWVAARKGQHEYDPVLSAVPAPWPYSDEIHSEALANPSDEYFPPLEMPRP